MKQTIRDVLTPNPVVLDANATFVEAAKAMREAEVGDVLVSTDGMVCGIVTDRDVVIRGLAKGADPAVNRIGEICSQHVTFVSPNDTVDDAMRLMRERALRRLPVIDGGVAVGIVSLGDLAIQCHDGSVLADISAAPANC
jgi:CBS domain-containing protein